ncbi:hypothetical protein ES708_34269 [subsurface metagenome]
MVVFPGGELSPQKSSVLKISNYETQISLYNIDDTQLPKIKVGMGATMIELTFSRLLSLARTARAAGRSKKERRRMLQWVIDQYSKIGASAQ